ncbi:MAG TPA: TRAP transporter permease [Syntrophorhabdaceae bacterium]|nr:TRAP transporter permease [Syntrophorhabdaceae bacterium]HOT41892.1 TRAP transporter permease [Syntrophorhabdaceae bacterium]HPC66426.1 TRAP transporter permease [Syntrophorhabdaceae bacterium]HQE79828.1 TRAP transporter permease [Syntrophorhabdaceae bacterium]HQH43293.1 TRAP transporter permease [Syntrophorhabdaceae bacterium]
MANIIAKIAAFFAICMSLFHLYTGCMGNLDPWSQRVIHLSLGFLITFLTYPYLKGRKINFIDIGLAILSLLSGLYVIINMDAIVDRAGLPTTWDIVFGVITILLVLEMTRRVIGLALVIVSVVFLLYAYFGPYLPDAIAHRGYSIERIATHMYTTLEGIYGVPIGVSATFVILFVIFGAFLEATKTGDFFINFANSIAGKKRGGPAKVAVISSGFFGTISGSAVANVVGTGTYTIPLMKRTGYAPNFAAAVEAVASSGGQLVPPVMGAAAFVISEMTGESYLKICLAAIIPSILYYTSLFTAVHMEARRANLSGLSDEEVPKFWGTLKSQGYLAISALVLIYFLAVELRSPSFSAFWAIVAALILSSIKKSTRLNLKGLAKALESGAKGALSVVAACAAAGIVVGVVTLTGLGLKFSGAIIQLAHGNLYLTLIFTMIASLILGMGLPTTAAYIICAILAVPALTNLGVNVLSAHLFVFYFAIISAITPPVALAAYAGAGIAKSDPMKTGLTACRIGLAAFIVPYMFVFNPALLMSGSVMNIIWVTFTALVGVYLLSSSVIGWWLAYMSVWERVLLFVASLLLIEPRVITDAIAVVFIIPVLLYQLKQRKKIKS